MICSGTAIRFHFPPPVTPTRTNYYVPSRLCPAPPGILFRWPPPIVNVGSTKNPFEWVAPSSLSRLFPSPFLIFSLPVLAYGTPMFFCLKAERKDWFFFAEGECNKRGEDKKLQGRRVWAPPPTMPWVPPPPPVPGFFVWPPRRLLTPQPSQRPPTPMAVVLANLSPLPPSALPPPLFPFRFHLVSLPRRIYTYSFTLLPAPASSSSRPM